MRVSDRGDTWTILSLDASPVASGDAFCAMSDVGVFGSQALFDLMLLEFDDMRACAVPERRGVQQEVGRVPLQ